MLDKSCETPRKLESVDPLKPIKFCIKKFPVESRLPEIRESFCSSDIMSWLILPLISSAKSVRNSPVLLRSLDKPKKLDRV